MDNFKEIQNTHLALTQYYRWYQVYEVPFTKLRIENQKDILTDDIDIETPAGILTGKENLEDRLKVYEGWQNAHHVKHTEVKQLNNNSLSLEADILYQNIRTDNSRFNYTIHYSTILKLREHDLPQFVSVKIQPTGNTEKSEFTPAYTDNRSKSFMHYCLYCMETANGNADCFEELLADKFELHLNGNDQIDSLDKFKKWIATLPARIKESRHTPKKFSSKLNDDQTIAVTVDFEWVWITNENKTMIAETHHECILENNLDERFARMKTMKVTQIKTKKQAAKYLCSPLRKNDRKHLTQIATSSHPVSLNIVLQKAPVSKSNSVS